MRTDSNGSATTEAHDVGGSGSTLHLQVRTSSLFSTGPFLDQAAFCRSRGRHSSTKKQLDRVASRSRGKNDAASVKTANEERESH